MPTRDEMIAWLKSFRPYLYLKTKDSEMFDSILAALSGPSEKRRKILAGHLYSWWSTYDFSELHKENYDKIRALILGHAAGEGEKERE